MYAPELIDRVAKAILSERTAGHVDWRDLMSVFQQEYRDQAVAALEAAAPAPIAKDAQQVIIAAQGSIIEGLQRERDALRKCVGDIEYYFRRWSGVLSEEREWMTARIRKMGSEIADGGGTVQTEIDLLRQQLARWEMFRKAENIPQTAIEAAIDVVAGYDEATEGRMAEAVAAAISVLCLHVPLQVALAEAMAPPPSPS